MTEDANDPITKTSGPCIVLAGAGTGKTWNIIQKIKHLIDNDICKPDEILCLTFSVEATNELKHRVAEEIASALDVHIRNFHSFSAQILREAGQKIDIDPDFEVLQPDDAIIMVHRYLGISPHSSGRYVKSISTAQDFGIDFDEINNYKDKIGVPFRGYENLDKHVEGLRIELNTMYLRPGETKEEKAELKARKKEMKIFLQDSDEYLKYAHFVEAWDAYRQMKKEKNYLDFSDLNYNLVKLFDIYGAEDIAERYKYVFIDEFQDVNKLQFKLIEHLALPHKNITVVGDPNQSIYAFRGSYKESFEHFKESFEVDESTDVFKLDKSYRSPNTILNVAHKLIQNNYEDPTECFLIQNAEGREGNAVELIETKNKDEEARKIGELVQEEVDKGTHPSEICVLVRTHTQAATIKQALDVMDIPAITAGRKNLMLMPEIKTAIGYISMLNNITQRTGTGEQAWWYLFHYKNALTPSDSIKIGRYLKKNRDEGVSIDQALLSSLNELDMSPYGKTIVERVSKKINELSKSSNKPLPDLVLDVYEASGLNRAFTSKRTTRNLEAMMNLKTFYDMAENFYKVHDTSLSSFIEYIEMIGDLGINVSASKVEEVEAVRLMTMHAVKGREFNTVIVSNMAEGRFPIFPTSSKPIIPKEMMPGIKEEIELLDSELSANQRKNAIREIEKATLLFEERRLCYVAFTRTKDKLILTRAKTYKEDDAETGPSKFLTEIEYQNNQNISITVDNDERHTLLSPQSKVEKMKSQLKQQLIESLDSEDFPNIIAKLIQYDTIKQQTIIDYSAINDQDEIIDKETLQILLDRVTVGTNHLLFDKENIYFSPTALLDYEECPKKYELSRILQMPERGGFGWSAASTGSFVHQLFEEGVRELFKTKEQYNKRAEELAKKIEWKGVNLEEVGPIIDVFWERHKDKYDENSEVEMDISATLGGYKFYGKADRIDVRPDGTAEIVDYKTNKRALSPKKRAWQMGYYAIGLRNQGKYKVSLINLEMLKLEQPYEGIIGENGDVTFHLSPRTQGFNLSVVEQELIETAQKIEHDYQTEFTPARNDEGVCRFCGYKFYCPDWEEET